MTREQAKIGEEVYIHGYIDEIRKDIVIIRNEGGYFGTVPNELKALEQEPCEDAISRKAVVKVVDEHTREDGTLDDDITVILEKIPSVNPKQETVTEFADRCRECGRERVLDKIRAEIENHCGLVTENHCKYCHYCNSVMGVREILEIIDKYKAESED